MAAKRGPRLRLVDVKFLFHAMTEDDCYQAFTVHAARTGDELALTISMNDEEGTGFDPSFLDHAKESVETVKKKIKPEDLEEQMS